MPHNATVEDVKKAYLLSWQLMLKANALYRDGSKLSQPLNSIADVLDLDAARRRSRSRRRSRVKVAEKIVYRYTRSGGGRLTGGPGTPRSGGSAGTRSTCTGVRGRHPWRDLPRHAQGGGGVPQHDQLPPSPSRSACSTGCRWKSTSMPSSLCVLEPNGMVQGNPHIKMTTSIIDYIFRELAITYLARHDLPQVSPDDLRGDALHREPAGDAAPAAPPSSARQARAFETPRTGHLPAQPEQAKNGHGHSHGRRHPAARTVSMAGAVPARLRA
ncbi:MAG: hypothetical protein U0736_01890 [Gemmataceae bacterium]